MRTRVTVVYIVNSHSTVQTQAQLSQSAEKERSVVEKEMCLQSRVKTLESQLSGTKQEKSQLLATLELERAKLQTLEESQQRYHTDIIFDIIFVCMGLYLLMNLFLFDNRDSAKAEALRTSYQQSMEELRKEKVCVCLSVYVLQCFIQANARKYQ